jgi:hypothetical protein
MTDEIYESIGAIAVKTWHDIFRNLGDNPSCEDINAAYDKRNKAIGEAVVNHIHCYNIRLLNPANWSSEMYSEQDIMMGNGPGRKGL